MGLTPFTRRGQGKIVERYGITFKSETEADMYSALLNAGVKFEYQKKYVIFSLVPKDKKNPLLSESGADQVKCTVDFEFERDGITYIVDAKGSKKFTTSDSTLRYNLLKHSIYLTWPGEKKNIPIKIVFIERKEVLALLKLARSPHHFWAYFLKLKAL